MPKFGQEIEPRTLVLPFGHGFGRSLLLRTGAFFQCTPRLFHSLASVGSFFAAAFRFFFLMTLFLLSCMTAPLPPALLLCTLLACLLLRAHAQRFSLLVPSSHSNVCNSPPHDCVSGHFSHTAVPLSLPNVPKQKRAMTLAEQKERERRRDCKDKRTWTIPT